MISSARTFGAPVTEPGGKAARIRSPSVTPSPSVPSTVETRCHRPGWGSAPSRSGTVTVPGTQTRLRSLRTRSTIITFSDRFLADRSSSASCAADSVGSSLRRAVPLIGLDVTVWPDRRRNSSGESDATAARVTPGAAALRGLRGRPGRPPGRRRRR